MKGTGIRFADIVIPESELGWSYDPSGGPGGQHANRASTRVTLILDLNAASGLDQPTRRRLIDRLGSRAPAGVVTVTVDETRSQWRNRSIARRRMTDLLERASIPERTRRTTNPTIRSKRQRLEDKRRRSALKRSRRRPEIDD